MPLVECPGCGQTLDMRSNTGMAKCPLCGCGVDTSASPAPASAGASDFRPDEPKMGGGRPYDSAPADPLRSQRSQPARPPEGSRQKIARGVPFGLRVFAIIAGIGMIIGSSLGWVDYRNAQGEIDVIRVTITVIAYVGCFLTAAGVPLHRLRAHR